MKLMKFMSVLLVLSSLSAFAQENCLESNSSIIQLDKSIKDADHKLKLKELNAWYKEKNQIEDNESPYLVSKVISPYPMKCESNTEKTFLDMTFVLSSSGKCEGAKEYSKSIFPLKKGDKKTNNPLLAQIFSKKDGKIEDIQIMAGGYVGMSKVYQVRKAMKGGGKVTYMIDTSINPALNPISVLDEKSGKVEITKQMTKLGFSGGISMGNNNGIGW